MLYVARPLLFHAATVAGFVLMLDLSFCYLFCWGFPCYA